MAIITCTETGGAATYTGRCTSNRTTYAGRVLATHERNGYDDSDFCAVVWDDGDGEGALKTVTYGTTRWWTYHNSATVDATPEVIWAAERWLGAVLADQAVAAAERDARLPLVGSTVKSLTTRGKACGVTGVVKWHGRDQYRSSRWGDEYRVGIAVDGRDALVYASVDRVEVLNPAPVDRAELIRRAYAEARRHNWRSGMQVPVHG